MKTIKQIYLAEVKIYSGFKLVLGGGTTLRFKYNKKLDYYVELDCAITKDNQKTLSSTKTSTVTIKCDLPISDTGIVNVGERFTISDGFDKIGKGKITEIIKQK